MYRDLEISKWVLENISKPFPFISEISKFVSEITSWGQAWYLFMIGIIIYKSIKEKRINIYLLLEFVIVGLGWILADKGIKNWIGRERPYQEIPEFATFAEALGYDYPSSPSFPSGHTLFSFGVAFIILKVNTKLGIISYVFATMIALSRIILGAHYLSDVIAGAAYGTLMGVLGNLFANFINPKLQPLLDKLIKKGEVS